MTDDTKKPNVALALSSGGARGLAHIGVIAELEARGYRISSIAGCSMGALIGGVYAAGKLNEFREWMKTMDRKKMLELTDFSLSINHIVKGKRIIEAIMEFVPDMAIEDLPIPYCAIATDLISGKEVVFNKGSLFEAIRASISLPSFYEPVHRDDMLLIDGGVINPIPLNRVKRQPGDILVGVDVSGHDYKSQWEEMRRLTERQKKTDNHGNVLTILCDKEGKIFLGMDTPGKQEELLTGMASQYGVSLTSKQLENGRGKSEKIINIGRQKASNVISKYESSLVDPSI